MALDTIKFTFNDNGAPTKVATVIADEVQTHKMKEEKRQSFIRCLTLASTALSQ